MDISIENWSVKICHWLLRVACVRRWKSRFISIDKMTDNRHDTRSMRFLRPVQFRPGCLAGGFCASAAVIDRHHKSWTGFFAPIFCFSFEPFDSQYVKQPGGAPFMPTPEMMPNRPDACGARPARSPVREGRFGESRQRGASWHNPHRAGERPSAHEPVGILLSPLRWAGELEKIAVVVSRCARFSHKFRFFSRNIFREMLINIKRVYE